MHKQLLIVGALALGVQAFGWTSQASADACSSLPNPVVVSGSTAIGPIVAKVAPILAAAAGDQKITLIYQGSGSCSGVSVLDLDTTPTGDCAAGACLTGVGDIYDAAGTKGSCDFAAAGTHIDLILSDVFVSSCENLQHAADLEQENLMVLPFAFIVPKGGDQQAIDVREAYFAYGDGAAGQVAPWTNENVLFQRNSGSGTQITIFKNIHVPVGYARGYNAQKGGLMVDAVAAGSNMGVTPADATKQPATDKAATLGFAGTDAIDPKRDKVQILAYRHWSQKKYYWPDSDKDSFNKSNVRDGHYPLWGYEHAVWRKGAKANAIKVADYFAGKAALPGSAADTTKSIEYLSTVGSVVPTCAMKVSRPDDAADFSAYTPDAACSCFFEKNVVGGKTDCASCDDSTPCADGLTCTLGYCEPKSK